jgi:hypothetical protein
LEEELDQDARVTDSIQSVQQNLTQDVFEGFGDFKITAKK